MWRFIIASIANILAIVPGVHADSGYDNEFIDLVEIVYGDGYLSQGGSEMVEAMFEGIELDEKKVLDLGCGIGGPALDLIKNHSVTVVGVDPEVLMIEKSRAALKNLRASTNKTLKGSASFVTMQDPLSLEQFPSNSFDIVTSKEAILHVPNEHKLNYFREIFRVLKTGGELVIVDWLHSSPNYSDDVKAMMEMDGVPFHLTTPQEYQKIVQEAGFSDVTLNDLTNMLTEQTNEDLETIDSNKRQITDRFDKKTFDYARNSWDIQRKAFANKELLVFLIKAVKN